MPTVYEYTDTAMGTEYSVVIVCNTKEEADHHYAYANKTIASYEEMCSRFMASSVLSQLNSKKDMIVPQHFFALIVRARELYRETSGVFNPLVQIKRAGYTRTFAEITDDTGSSDTPYDIDFETVLLDEATGRIVLQTGQEFDLGGFLKGYLSELIAETISPRVSGVLINIGGDMTARGNDNGTHGFICSVYNPITDTDIPVTLLNQSLATSGTYKRSWQQSGKRVHHILDKDGVNNPRTSTISASVIATDGAQAEAYAKVLLALPSKDSTAFLSEHTTSWIRITNDGTIHTS